MQLALVSVPPSSLQGRLELVRYVVDPCETGWTFPDIVDFEGETSRDFHGWLLSSVLACLEEN
jgi:hypothetical protein